MKTSCEIIRDLIPLYVDEAASPASRQLVEEHLAECSDCREICSRLQDRETEERIAAEKEEVIAGQRRFFRRKVALFGSIAASIVVLPVLVGLIVNQVKRAGFDSSSSASPVMVAEESSFFTESVSAGDTEAPDIVQTKSVEKQMLTLKEAVELFPYIMTVTLEEREKTDSDVASLLRMHVEKIWQGSDWKEDTILLKTYDDIFKKNTKYILFLTHRESVFKGYEYFTAGPVLFGTYNPYINDLIARNYKELEEAVSKAVQETYFKGDTLIKGAYIHSDDLQVIKEESPCIFKVLVQEIVNEWEDRTVVQCSVLETLKGSSAAQIMAAVGKESVQVGEEYYLLLDNPDPEGVVFIISSPHSVIPADSPEAMLLK